MRCFSSFGVCLFFLGSALFAAAPPTDAGGCADLKLFPKIVGCTIRECSSKRHDSFEFELSADERKTLDGGSESLTY